MNVCRHACLYALFGGYRILCFVGLDMRFTSWACSYATRAVLTLCTHSAGPRMHLTAILPYGSTLGLEVGHEGLCHRSF